MSLPPPPQDNDSIITQFKPVKGQWGLNDENIKRIDPQTGQTILHNYCDQINTTPLEVYRYLIETKGCDVNVQVKNKNTPLHDAIRSFDPNDGGDITVLMYLLTQKSLDLNIKGREGDTLLHIAFDKMNKFPLDVFKLLIETHGCDINGVIEARPCLFHIALRHFNGDSTALAYLLRQGAVKINIKDLNFHTLLHYACESINKLSLDVFKVLIETMGYDVNAQDKNNCTPLHNALRYFNPNEGGDITVLHYLLSQKGIDGNIKDKFGYTLLHWACQRINRLRLDIFKVLIEKHGADVNVQDDGKNTPLHRAFEYFNPQCGGDINVLVYLINQKNINLNIKYKNGYTLLHTTCIINPSNTRYPMKTNAECDTTLCQIVELIAERCVQEVFDEKTPLEAATTM
jgi:ankyrin repeat protein